MSLLIPALIGAIGSIGLGAWQTAQNYETTKKNFNLEDRNYQFQKDSFERNFALQKESYEKNYALNKEAFQFQKDSYLENLNYQKALQQQIFNREDNSVQRRVADLQAAGLSKTLAAGDGAGAGTVVSTSPFSGGYSGSNFSGSSFNGKAPRMSQIDLVSTGLQLASAMANIRQVSAETENALKQNQVMDSQMLNDQVNRDYTTIKAAIEQGNLDMLGLTRQQKISVINHTNALTRSVDEQIRASMQNREINNYKLSTMLPAEYNKTIEQIANLKKQGKIYDADLIYKNLQSDLLTQTINKELFLSKIAEMDMYYQYDTGFKPSTNSNWIVNLIGALTQSDLVGKAAEAFMPSMFNGRKTNLRDNTPR